MLKVELWIDDSADNEEMISKEIMRLITENGIKVSTLNIDRMKREYKKPEIKEIQIPDFLKKSQVNKLNNCPSL